MKLKFLYIIAFLFAANNYAQTAVCGSIINDTFETKGSLPAGWTEYNTSGRVTVADGHMIFNHNTTMPSAYRTFDPVTGNFLYSFDVQGSRSSANCQIDLVSTDDKHIASIAIGKGTADFKYATSIGTYIAGVGGTEKFSTNTNYSLSVYVDFTTQTVDFYFGGELTLEDIPFLETADNVSKLDIQLLYMYNNNGTFFFDNISILETDSKDQLALYDAVSLSQTLLNEASIGDAFHQYPQSAADAFQQVIDAANIVLTDCDASNETMVTALADLQSAETVFISSKIDPDALTLYSAYDFSGEEKDMKSGYYNGDLGDFDDKTVSFKLEKGYMATFAQDVNGTGVSKVYIASEANLAINLPADLQKTVSFIRVGPWFDVHKKGMAGKGIDVIQEFNNSWHYNWSTSGNDVGDVKFVPNQWSGGGTAKAIELGNRMDIAHYMAFNEPDGSEQANMTVDIAIEKYEAMLASGLRLGSPANKDNANGGVWRDEFMTKAEAKGYRVDYIVVHYYKKTSPANFYNWLIAIHDKWKRPIWIKEFNYGATWTAQPASNEAAGNGLISYMDMLDDASFVERYAVFTWQPDKPIYSLMSVRNPVTLSASGIMYRNHESPVAYTQEVYEQGEQLSVDGNSLTPQVLIYPTIVTNGVLNLIYSSELKNKKLQLSIYNAAGQIVNKEINVGGKIDVSKLSSGFYIVKIKSGTRHYTEKFIIQ